MNKTTTFSLAFGLLGLLMTDSVESNQPIQVDGIVAMVNERPITHGEIQIALEPMLMRWQRQYQGNEWLERYNEAYERMLQNAIDRALILEEFATKEFEIPAAAIDDEVQMMISREFNGNRTALLQTLAAEGLSMQEWRDQIRDTIAINMMRGESLRGTITPISPRQIRAAYEENREEFKISAASRIWMITLRSFEDVPDDETAELARRIVGELRGGADFAELAQQYSVDGFASEGGDRGWIDPERYLRSELAAAAQSLEPGEISDPVELTDAATWHILHVTERRSEGLIPFEDVHDQLVAQLREAEEQRAYRAWIDRLKRRHHVHIIEQETDSLLL